MLKRGKEDLIEELNMKENELKYFEEKQNKNKLGHSEDSLQED